MDVIMDLIMSRETKLNERFSLFEQDSLAS